MKGLLYFGLLHNITMNHTVMYVLFIWHLWSNCSLVLCTTVSMFRVWPRYQPDPKQVQQAAFPIS